MKKSFLFTLLTLAAALPAFAIERHQSFISYDDGGTVIRSGDGREVEATRNVPVFPEDEVVTARRGRAEVRLSDGNIIGIDRATALRFDSILDSYEGEGDETVAQLRYGKVAVYRTDLGRDHVRLDTDNASYVADDESIYSVESDGSGRDRVIVFEGSVEVRTPSRVTRLRAGEAVSVDDRGVYDVVEGQQYGADDFDRWFLERANRFEEMNSRYVDRDLGYWADDLDGHGAWVTVAGYGSVWRPTVSIGWRPYHNGYWHRSRWGTLTWVSYDPWGWGPFHYGRWAYDPFYGWFWVPGYGYSPAWVYWMYGSGYVGWAPSGWWDCYRPYYSWAYEPYSAMRHGFGFWGRVRVNDLDLRPWTFVDSVGLVSRRVDRAALTADAVKHRLGREGVAAVSGDPARFTNEELRDPAEAIRRRSIDGHGGRSVTGRETGAPATDLTPFFRRDGEISGTIRDRIRGGSSTRSAAGGSVVNPAGRGSTAPAAGGVSAPSRGSIDRRGSGGAAPGRIDRGSGTSRGGVSTGSGTTRGGTVAGSTPESPGAGSVRRGTVSGGGGAWRGGSSGSGSSGSSGSVSRETGSGSSSGNSSSSNRGSRSVWRGRESGGGTIVLPPSNPPSTSAPSGSSGGSNESSTRSWRSRGVGSGGSSAPDDRSGSSTSSRSGDSHRGSSDVPRRVIDRIGGARIVPRDGGSSTGSSSGSSSGGRTYGGGSSSSGRSSGPARTYGGGSSSSGRSSGSSAGVSRSGGSSSGSSSPSSSSSTSSSSSGGSRGGNGTVHRRD